tara:strand:+ start:2593 stop:2709 length:117 start_codon:yes stop_codon:yes gene_type:complete
MILVVFATKIIKNGKITKFFENSIHGEIASAPFSLKAL